MSYNYFEKNIYYLSKYSILWILKKTYKLFLNNNFTILKNIKFKFIYYFKNYFKLQSQVPFIFYVKTKEDNFYLYIIFL